MKSNVLSNVQKERLQKYNIIIAIQIVKMEGYFIIKHYV